MEHTKEELEAMHLALDKVFLKYTGKTYRPAPRSDPSRNGDATGQILPDFSKLLNDD